MRRAALLSVVGIIVATLTMFATPSAAAEKTSGVGAQAFTIFHVLHTGFCLDIFNASTAPGAGAIQWPCNGDGNQLFEVFLAPESAYYFRAVHSRQCLDIFNASTAAGARLIQWPCNGDRNQRFRLISAGSGTVFVQAVHSGQCLDVFNASFSPGARVIQWPCNGDDNQRWY